MKVVLSSNIEHYRHTAKALEENNYLEKYISCALYKEKPWYYSKSGNMQKWIDNRIENDISFDLIEPFSNEELVYKIIRNSRITQVIPKSKVDRFFNNIFDVKAKKKIDKLDKIDCFHYVSGIGYSSAVEAKRKFNCKIIVDDRAEHKGFLYELLREEYKSLGLEFNDKNFWNVDCRRDYDIADYIITPSSFSKSTFIEQGIDPNKLIVIPYGCDTKLFYPQERKSDGKFRVIYVGSICIRKGAYYLLKAFEKINNPNIELLLIGKVEKELESIMENRNENVRHIEYVPNNKLNDYYAQSDVFILPSLSDSFSLATLEAMSAGIPVIISENVGAKDYVSNGESGYIIPIRSEEKIIEKIQYLYNNSDKLKKFKQNLRNINTKTMWGNYQQKIKELYKKLEKED